MLSWTHKPVCICDGQRPGLLENLSVTDVLTPLVLRSLATSYFSLIHSTSKGLAHASGIFNLIVQRVRLWKIIARVYHHWVVAVFAGPRRKSALQSRSHVICTEKEIEELRSRPNHECQYSFRDSIYF